MIIERGPACTALDEGRKDIRIRRPKRDGDAGRLFDGQSQLVVYHFMFGPDWNTGCRSCSFIADHSTESSSTWPSATSRLSSFRARRLRKSRPTRNGSAGTSNGCRRSETAQPRFPRLVHSRRKSNGAVYIYRMARSNEVLPGFSAFFKNDNGEILHTYSTYARGLDILIRLQLPRLGAKRPRQNGRPGRSGCVSRTSTKARRNPVAAALLNQRVGTGFSPR